MRLPAAGVESRAAPSHQQRLPSRSTCHRLPIAARPPRGSLHPSHVQTAADNTRFKFGYLTKQNAAWAALGINIFGSKFTPVDLVKGRRDAVKRWCGGESAVAGRGGCAARLTTSCSCTMHAATHCRISFLPRQAP
jgi:hypothetical protein